MKSIQRFEPYMLADSHSLESRIELEMMRLGSGVITDLDRFLMPNLNDCYIYGNAIDYFGGSVYDDEPCY